MAAAVLLKERNQNMCKPQAVISTLLYAGHAFKGDLHFLLHGFYVPVQKPVQGHH